MRERERKREKGKEKKKERKVESRDNKKILSPANKETWLSDPTSQMQMVI